MKRKVRAATGQEESMGTKAGLAILVVIQKTIIEVIQLIQMRFERFVVQTEKTLIIIRAVGKTLDALARTSYQLVSEETQPVTVHRCCS